MVCRIGLSSLLLGLILASPAGAQSAQPSIAGRWEGAVLVLGTELQISVTFRTDGAALAASIDIPQQGATGLPLTAVRHEAGKVHFELPAGPSLAVFDGTLKDGEIAGQFTQGLATGTFTLKRAAAKAAAAPAPAEPLPYAEEEVTVTSGSVTLAGTLSTPKAGGPFPAIVLVSGSGPQNRDEDVFGFKVFRTLADHLARSGFAVLRTDDRGVGKSTGNLASSTSEDFAADALAAVALLRSRPDIDGRRIGLMGHSEGGLVAPLAASRAPDVAFIVLMAGPGVTGERIMIAQGELIGRAEGRSEDDIRRSTELQRRLFAAARAGTGWDELRSAIRKEVIASVDKAPPEQRKGIADVGQYADRAADSQIKMVQSTWFRFFLDHDPAPVLSRVPCPVLALLGELDLQVPPALNQPALASALGGGRDESRKVVVIPKANHLFQLARTGSPREYAALDKAFAPAFLEELTAWLRVRAAR